MATVQVHEKIQLQARTPVELKAIIDASLMLVQELPISLSPEGISIRVMDAGHLGLIDLFLPESCFESYYCSAPADMVFNGKQLKEILKKFGKKDGIRMLFDTEKNSLQISGFKGSSNTIKGVKLEGKPENLPLPKLSFDSTVELASQLFDNVLTDAQVVSAEYVLFKVKDRKFKLTAKGDSGEADILLDTYTEGIKSINTYQESEAGFRIDFLMKLNRIMLRAISLVKVEFSQNRPLRLEYMIGDYGKMHFYLAPQVREKEPVKNPEPEKPQVPAEVKEEIAHDAGAVEYVQDAQAENEIHVDQVEEMNNEQEQKAEFDKSTDEHYSPERAAAEYSKEKDLKKEPVSPKVHKSTKKPVHVKSSGTPKWYYIIKGTMHAHDEESALGILQEAMKTQGIVLSMPSVYSEKEAAVMEREYDLEEKRKSSRKKK